MQIHVLPQTLINQIAAGEVVVNMASVVKELLENAVDAGARNVEVDLSADLRSVTITDDGGGMDQEDAELALQRHATSKIRSTEDLNHLMTRGFRGEALPSIASVSRMEIVTRPPDAVSGTRVVVEGGTIETIEPAGAPAGTRIVIRDLFFNTPARRKFLKSTTAEMNTIMKTVTRQALSERRVGFTVRRDGEERLRVPAGEDAEDRFLAFAGPVERDDLVALQFERASDTGAFIKVGGHVVQPHTSRANRSTQYLFVNGRPFTAKSIAAAIEQACRGFITIGRFPAFCIFIDVPPEEVDFNVHPTKEEVRFQNERAVAGACYRAVKEALEARGFVPEMKLDEEDHAPTAKGNDVPGVFTTPDTQAAPTTQRTEQSSFLTSPELLVNRAFERQRARRLQEATNWQKLADERAPHQPVSPEYAPAVESAAETLPPSLDHTAGETAPGADDAPPEPVSAGPGEKPDADFWGKPWEPEPLGQIAWTYVLVRFGEDLLIVDQHAAHERIRYIELERRAAAPASQPLLVPEVLEVSAAQRDTVERLMPVLQESGFELEPFGPRAWQITAVPADLEKVDVVRLLTDVLDDAEENPRANRIETLRQNILIRAACHSSIRAGRILSLQEQKELLNQMQRYQLSFTCPHGRPTVIRLSKGELDKRFKR